MGQKAEAFAEFAKSLGWEAKVNEEGQKATVTAQRDSYTLSISWRGEACLNETTLDDGAGVRKIRNAGAAKRKLEELSGEATRAPESTGGEGRTRAKARNAPAATRTRRKPKPEPIEPVKTTPKLPKRLPFDLEAAPDEEIIKAVIGRKIIWRNVLASRYEEARVMARPKQRHLRIERNRKDERCLTWCAEEDAPLGEDTRGPFRSVKLANIIQIV